MVPLVVINDIKLISDVLCSMRRCDVESSWYLHVMGVSKFFIFLVCYFLLSEHRVVLVLHPVSFRSDKKIVQHLSFKNKPRQHTLADPGGRGVRQGHTRPLAVQFLSLSCSFWGKNDQIIAFSCSTLELAPPENPGPATDIDLFILLSKMIGTWWSL